MTRARAVVVESFGFDGLRLIERDVADPPPGHVAVDVKAASLNFRDVLMVQGLYDPKQRLPLVPCSDGAGVVAAVGDGVTSPRVGDRVVTLFAAGWTGGPPTRERLQGKTLGGPLDGTLATRVVLPQDGVAPAPPHLDDVEAATLPCAGVTAWSALVVHGAVKAGDVVVVQGAGGVSLFALAIAKLHGARVLAIASTPEKAERLRALGADVVVDRAADWVRAARDETGGRGADVVVDVAGAPTIAQSIRAVAIGGMVAVVGNAGGNETELSVIPILMRNIRVQGVIVGPRDAYVDMARAFAQAGTKPVIDRVYDLADARAAFERVASGAHVGKVVVRLS